MTARSVLVIVSALVVQVAIAAPLSPGGHPPELLLLVAVLVGLVAGPARGAGVGFGCGIAMDLVVRTPFGLWGLALTLAGWAAGHLRDRLHGIGRLGVPVLAAGLSTGGILLLLALGGLIGQDALVRGSIGATLSAVAVLHLLLAPLALPVVRWAELDESERRGRR